VTLLQCSELCKSYGEALVLDHVSFSLRAGEITGLLGPNGSGKTTLIKIANGLLTKNSGKILIAGQEPGIQSKKIISYLPERSYIPDWMTMNQLILFFQDFYDDFQKSTAEKMIYELNINDRIKLREMSKGMKEKVQLILVMSRQAQLYILDEPIGGVDPAARDYIIRTIIGNYREDSAVLIATHLIAEVENILDHVLFIDQGKIVLDKASDEIRENKNQSIDSFFREVFRCS